MNQFEIAIHEIAEEIESQARLEEYQRSKAITVYAINNGRAASYVRISVIVSKTLAIDQPIRG
jgi:hypothetical protein